MGAALLYGALPATATEAERTVEGAHLALLLPLRSAAFGRLADALRAGFVTAATLDRSTPPSIVVHADSDDPAEIAHNYRAAVEQGARLIVGPLTRNGVNFLLRELRPGVPVLALNAPDDDGPWPDGFYAFSLQAEQEARQVARMAFSEGRRAALVISDAAALSQRIHKAFVDEFVRHGGRASSELLYRGSAADLAALREASVAGSADTVFLALDAVQARVVRAYLTGRAQVFATSQVFDGQPGGLRDTELNGVRFVDMPWLLQPDHPAVAAYPRADSSARGGTDFERLYAFGIDAYRIAAELMRAGSPPRDPLDGVTGLVYLAGRRFLREPTAAEFAEGVPVPLASRR